MDKKVISPLSEYAVDQLKTYGRTTYIEDLEFSVRTYYTLTKKLKVAVVGNLLELPLSTLCDRTSVPRCCAAEIAARLNSWQFINALNGDEE